MAHGAVGLLEKRIDFALLRGDRFVGFTLRSYRQ
jgi:hypothetical protein